MGRLGPEPRPGRAGALRECSAGTGCYTGQSDGFRRRDLRGADVVSTTWADAGEVCRCRPETTESVVATNYAPILISATTPSLPDSEPVVCRPGVALAPDPGII